MKQGLSFFLILIILIAPIASALEICSSMDMSVHLSDSQNLTTIISPAENIRFLDHKKMLKDQHDNQIELDCHASNNCTLHACGGYGITSTPLTVHTVISSYYSNYEYSSPYNTTLSTDLRPPILYL
jgi:hypothetical protein